ncbi:hypothetical protein V5279_40725 [Bradyrhizobium sp. 26S5]|uniref:hypothetical protein n=1 Tax=Bradyrhizobium sp. 26S5 TaxID=3139729 RepID=UPI0030CC2C66
MVRALCEHEPVEIRALAIIDIKARHAREIGVAATDRIRLGTRDRAEDDEQRSGNKGSAGRKERQIGKENGTCVGSLAQDEDSAG